MRATLGDLRHGVSTLRRSPWYAMVAVLTLGLGIGATIAMFTVIDGVILKPLPYAAPDRLVLLWNRHERTGADKVQVSGPDFLDYGERSTSLVDMAAIHNTFDSAITGESTGEQIDLAIVSANFFDFLGRHPMLGRGFIGEDGVFPAGAGPAPVVLSHGLWARRYGSDETLVGRTIDINGAARLVIGVMPPDFELILPSHDGGMVGGGAFDDVDVWATFPPSWFDSGRGMGMFRVLARLADDATVAQAQLELNVIAEQLREEHAIHEERGVQIDLYPLHADIVGEVRPIVFMLFGSVGVVLLIACANVANLALVRGTARAREVAIRAALGGTRWRIVGELLAESAVVAVCGGLVGLLLAAVAIKAIVALAPAQVPRIDEIGISPAALLFSLGACVVALLLSGALPAARASTPRLVAGLRDVGATTGAARSAGRQAIVVTEVALSMVLLVGGALLLQSFVHVANAPLGFDAERTLTAKISLPGNRYGGRDNVARLQQFYDAVQSSSSSLPGVEAIGYAWPVPFGGRGADVPYASQPGDSVDWGRNVATRTFVSAGFFEAMDATLLSGRFFAAEDLRDARDVVVIDDLAAQRLFEATDVAGRTIWIGSPGSTDSLPHEIAGVIAHIRHDRLVGVEREAIYLTGVTSMGLVVRTSGDPRLQFAPIEDVIRRLDPEAALFEAKTFAAVVDEQLATARFATTLATVFAGLAVLLSAIGLYGVISYSVSRQTGDLGVRMALGAERRNIMGLVLGQGLSIAAVGVLLGLIAAIGTTRVIASLLYGVTATDPATFVGVALLLLVVTAMATYMPARRATRVDPLRALRMD